MKFAIGGCATTVFALLVIATAPLATASPDTEFVDALASKGLSIPPQAKRAVITAGHSVCRDFANGTSFEDAVAKIAGRGVNADQSLAATFVKTATTMLCPEFVDKLG
jgi:hypothetical protein